MQTDDKKSVAVYDHNIQIRIDKLTDRFPKSGEPGQCQRSCDIGVTADEAKQLYAAFEAAVEQMEAERKKSGVKCAQCESERVG
jgi:hypothetical protein